jgi:hypothetical protein
MEVIDKILNEWSFRCHDGIVDLNNPEKVKILFEILKPLVSEDIDDDILNLLINTDEDVKTKVLNQLKKINKRTDNDLKSILTRKNIGALVKTIVYDAEELGQEDELSNYLHSSNQITLNQLQDNNNLISLLSKTGLSEEMISALINISGNLGNVALGKGEIALTTLLGNAKRAGKGDIDVDGKKVEIKSGGSEAVPDNLSRGKASEVNLMLVNIIDNIFTDNSLKEELKDIILKLGTKGSWPAKIDVIYKEYLKQKQEGNTKSTFKEELNQMLKNLYKSNIEIESSNYLTNQEFLVDQFKVDIAKKLAEVYSKQTKFDYILFFNPTTLNYKVYQEKEFIEAIGNEIKVGGFSDSLPRLTYSQLD